MIGRRRPARLPGLMLALLVAAGARAHDGLEHERAGALAAVPSARAPRIAFSTAQVEVLVVREPTALVIYVDDFATNAPRTGLQLSLQTGDQFVTALAAADGSYRVPVETLGTAAAAPLPVDLRLHGDDLDARLHGELPPAAPEPESESASEPKPKPDGRARGSVVATAGAVTAGAAGLGVLVALGLRRRRRR